MSAPAGTSVSVAELAVLCELGAGGQGTVVLAQAPSLASAPMAFKEYAPSVLVDVDVEALERLVTLPSEVDDGLRRLLREHTAWPVATVHRDGAVCGFLMPAAPDEFRSYLRLPTGYEAQLLAMEFLLNPPGYMANVDLPVTERSRLALLSELAKLLRDLHRHGVVAGDLSPKNVLISLRFPRCYLLDCDAMRVQGRSVLPQIETPDWRLPAGEELATEASDRFKFGLLVIRLLRSDQSASDPELLRQGQPALADLAARNRTGPGTRPSWDEWIEALDTAIPLASTSVPAAPSGPAPPAAPSGPAPRGAPAPPTVPAPQPAPAATVLSRPTPSSTRRNTLLTLLVVAALAILIGMLSGVFDSGDDRDGGVGPGPAPENGYGVDDAVPADAGGLTSVGVVEVTEVDPDQDTLRVAELFDAYFQGVNARDWDAVLELYDPAGVVDSTDPDQRRSFISGMETTLDSEVVLRDVRTSGGRVLARVTFRSEQAPGYGPKDDPDQTCTRWEVMYELTPYRDGYRILRPDRYSYDPC